MGCLSIPYASSVSPKLIVSTYTFQLTINVTTKHSIHLCRTPTTYPHHCREFGRSDAGTTQFVVSLVMCSNLPSVNGSTPDRWLASQTLSPATGKVHPIRSADFLLRVNILLGGVLPVDALPERLTDGPLSRWRQSPQYPPWPMGTLAPKPCVITSTSGCTLGS